MGKGDRLRLTGASARIFSNLFSSCATSPDTLSISNWNNFSQSVYHQHDIGECIVRSKILGSMEQTSVPSRAVEVR